MQVSCWYNKNILRKCDITFLNLYLFHVTSIDNNHSTVLAECTLIVTF